MAATTVRKLRMGMIGGGRGALIGEVHRTAARLHGGIDLVAGCFGSTADRSLAAARELGVQADRAYPTWQAMLEKERTRAANARLDFIAIVTPNDLHFDVARACLQAGFHVVCDKPMTTRAADADELVRLAESTSAIFAMTYNYSGYAMVKHARHLVRSGALGPIVRVVVEYNQGWLSDRLESTGHKQAAWRTDPAHTGGAGAIGDIGSHAEQLMSYVTGLEIESLAADLTTVVPERAVDDDAAMLLRFKPRDGVRARGMLCASQVLIGSANDLRIRVHGRKGSLAWNQEDPNTLLVRMAGESDRIDRPGSAGIVEHVRQATRLPPGHPEGFLEAFANIYRAVGNAILAGAAGIPAAEQFDFPGVIDGARGVHFIHAAMASSRNNAQWTRLNG